MVKICRTNTQIWLHPEHLGMFPYQIRKKCLDQTYTNKKVDIKWVALAWFGMKILEIEA